jgi:hypothetical protein
MNPNPQFLPVKFPPGPPTTLAWEDGPSIFANAGSVIYNGQNQTSKINTAKPMPPWELGPGPADPNISGHRKDYTGSGYGPIGQGTIGVGNRVAVTPGPPPAQARMYIQGNNLIILDNTTGQAFAVPLAAAIPQPANYSPTK